MNFKRLLTDDRAVSPVIGVILMVAITVILAAVIGTFVLGLGEGLNQAPQVQFDFQYNETASTVDVIHQGGAQLDNSTLTMNVGGTPVPASNYTTGPFTAGDAIVQDATYSAGDSVTVVWESPDGGSSQIIGESTAPSS